MEKWEPYFHQPKPINELINNALIVVDTNVLLAAYQWREVTVKEVVKTLKFISDEHRLRIPLQVIREFSTNRPKELIQRINDIETLISGLQSQKSLNQKVPMLEGGDIYEETNELQEHYNEGLKLYKDGLIKIRENIKGLFHKDSYLEELKEIIEKSYYSPDEQENLEALKKLAEKRFKEKIPPGYKDDQKESNSIGDYIIWDSIIKLKSNVVFVSGDKKIDWVYRDSKKNPIAARRELVEEFYVETGGKDFAFLSPKEFIALFNPDITDEIKEDLSIDASLEESYDALFYARLLDPQYNFHSVLETLLTEGMISGYTIRNFPIVTEKIEIFIYGIKEGSLEVASYIHSYSQGKLIVEEIH